MADTRYEEFLRARLTELRLKKGVSEHRMSLDLDKSGSYIRGISSGAAMPSVRELFNMMDYFEVTPSEFFAPLDNTDTPYAQLCKRLRELSTENLNKIETLVGWLENTKE